MPHDKRLLRHQLTLLTVVGTAYILSFFHRFAPAAIAQDLQQTFHASSAELGSLAATYFYVYTVMQIPTGILADTWGARRLVTLGGLIAGIGSILFGMADSLAAASIGRLLVGLGVSVMFISLLKLNANWFHDRHFATMTGVTILLGNVGSFLATAPLSALLGVASWRSVFVAIGLLSIILAGLAAWLVRNQPQDIGIKSLRELDGHAAHAAHTGHWLDGLKIVLKNRATWPGLVVSLGMAGSLFAFGGLWAVPFLQDAYDMSRTVASAHTSTLIAGFAVGAFFIGSLSDKLGKRKPVMLAAATLYCFAWLPFLAHLNLANGLGYALFFVMGIGASGFTLTWSCAKEVNPHALSGMATSVVNTGGFLGTALLQPLVGRAIDAQRGSALAHGFSDYQTGIALLAGAALLGLLAILFIRETHCRYAPTH
ncbi:MAG: MFS transporter [Gallionella sp.]